MSMMGRGSPAGGAGAGASAALPTASPNMTALSPGARAGMANLGGPAMAAMAAMASGSGGAPGMPGNHHANMKMSRYLPPTMIQQQVFPSVKLMCKLHIIYTLIEEKPVITLFHHVMFKADV